MSAFCTLSADNSALSAELSVLFSLYITSLSSSVTQQKEFFLVTDLQLSLFTQIKAFAFGLLRKV